jgi:hypothetical protein
VNHLAQRAVIGADRPRAIDVRPCATMDPAAARALRDGDADRAPRGERIAAAIAERRREREDRLPAARADRAARGMVERFVARRAGRRENDG